MFYQYCMAAALILLIVAGCAPKIVQTPAVTPAPSSTAGAASLQSGPASELALAISKNDLGKVKSLIDGDPKLISSKGLMGLTPIHLASSGGNVEILEYLISKGANVNDKDEQGNTPLHNAAGQGQIKAMEILIAKGAELEARNRLNLTPLQMAVMGKKKDAAQLLLAKKADINVKGGFGGETCLHYAAAQGDTGMAKFLLEKGASPEAVQDLTGQTPLFLAASAKQKGMVELLIAKGAKVNARDRMGLCPLDVAEAANKRSDGLLLSCKSNMKNIGTALEMYATDHGGHYPESLSELMPDYLSTLPTCIAARKDTYSPSYHMKTSPDSYEVYCSGENHRASGVARNYPRYTAEKGLDTGPKVAPVADRDSTAANEIVAILKKHGAKNGKLTMTSSMPVSGPLKSTGTVTGCKSNMKNIGTALEMYSTDNVGHYPKTLGKLVPDYLKKIPACPAAGKDTYSASYRSKAEPDCYEFFCKGEYHKDAGLKKNRPRYNSQDGLLDR